MLEQKTQLSLEQDLRHESEATLVKARSDLQEEQQRARKLEAGHAASEARAAELVFGEGPRARKRGGQD